MLTHIGPYQLKHQLGAGGMATVWYAENALGKEFAVKVLKADLMQYEHAAERFRNEAKIMVGLRHSHIRQVFDYYEDESTMAIIMEYLDGKDLFQYSRDNGAIDEKQTIGWFESILDAVGYVHQKSYFHRDIKPSNLFLTKDGLVKVMDFGIAKLINSDSNLTATTTAIGSPQYMSPEQIMTPKQVDYRTDIYSLGVTLYALLSGNKPYDDSSGSTFTIHREIIQSALPRLTGVSATVNDAIQKATQKAPDERFQSCQEFRNALVVKEVVAPLYNSIADGATEIRQLSDVKADQPIVVLGGSDQNAGQVKRVPPPIYGNSTVIPPKVQVPPIEIPPSVKSTQQNNNQTYTTPPSSTEKPANWLIGAIFITLFCFWPLGIASLFFALQVNSSFDKGDVAGAWANSSKARTCFWIGLFLAPLSWFNWVYPFGTLLGFIYNLFFPPVYY
jgi:serine/threonine protein kinase